MRPNVQKTIETFSSKINPNYDMMGRHYTELREMSDDLYFLVCNAFVFGYAQGYKAARAELKRKDEVA